MIALLLIAYGFVQLGLAKDVHHNWRITWVNAAPDGYERPVIGINGQWPCPELYIDVGDRLIIDVHNDLGNQSTAIHWHGLHQYMVGTMDGSSSATQCPIAPGQSMRYDFVVEQAGTFWYHSHNMGQYPDGLRGPLIVHDPKAPFEYEGEFTVTLTDWYHREMVDLLGEYESQANVQDNHGWEPLPDAALINDSDQAKFKVLPNTTYLVHIVCIGAWPGHAFVFDQHDVTVVEVDGVYTESYDVGDKNLRVAPGQRVSVLLRTKEEATKNYAIWDTMDINMMFFYPNRAIPEGFNENATAWLVYDETLPLPPPPTIYELNFVDDVTDLVPLDHEPLLEPVDHQFILNTERAPINGVERYTINGVTYLMQDVPSLYTALTVGPEYNKNPAVYGQVNPIVIEYGEVVEIVINNFHANLHPWHLHGHQFQVLQRTEPEGGYFTGYTNVSSTPIRRDTIMVQNHGHVVIRFRANNPGVWLLHCHIEFHNEAGLMATIVEAPDLLNFTIPRDHLDVCNSYPLPAYGNAAGNYGLNLTGANTEVKTTDEGATYPPDDMAAPGTATNTPDDMAAPTTATYPPNGMASPGMADHIQEPKNHIPGYEDYIEEAEDYVQEPEDHIRKSEDHAQDSEGSKAGDKDC